MDDNSLRCHEISLYFVMKPKGIKEFKCRSFSMGGDRERVCWLPIDRLNEYTLFPTFFKSKLANLKDTVEHITTRE